MEKYFAYPDFAYKFQCAAETCDLARRATSSRALVVGYSGGADSTVLLDAVIRWSAAQPKPIYVCAVHVHHGIRGGEADDDEAFCRKRCAISGVDCRVIRVDAPALARQRGLSLEEAAREARYAAFLSVSRSLGGAPVLTAHHSGDNLETVLFHLARGTGLAGLTGIPPVRQTGGISIVRPLLSFDREEILAYCAGMHLPYCTDSTNTDTTYTRNFIRTKIIPRLHKINPETERSASRMCASLRADEDFLCGVAEQFCLTHLSCGWDDLPSLATDGGEVAPSPVAHAPLDALRALHPAVLARVLRMMYDRVGEPGALTYTHVAALIRLIERAGAESCAALPARCFARVAYGKLILSRNRLPRIAACGADFYHVLTMGEHDFTAEGFFVALSLSEANYGHFYGKNNENIYKLFKQAYLCSDKINGNIYVRNRREGDRYRCGTMTRRLKKMFADAKIAPQDRARWPIICDDAGILWVPGFGVRDDVDAKKMAADQVLQITVGIK